MRAIFKTPAGWATLVVSGAAIASGACSQQSPSSPFPEASAGQAQSAAGAVGVAGAAEASGGSDPGSTAAGSTGIAGTSSVGGAVGSSGGGSTVGNAAGSTGASTTKLCATKVTASSAQIANFENFDGMETVDKYAFAFGGPTNGTAGVYAGAYGYAGGTDVVTLAILAGHTGNYGLTESTMPATSWGQGLGFWMGCVDASAYEGITFWVRGSVPTGVFSFGLNTENTTLPDATNAAAGGTCPGTTDTCKTPTKSALPITMDWTQVSVLWADLTGGLSGATPVTVTGDTITGFTLLMSLNYTNVDDAGYTPTLGNISFAIDDIAFMP
jgi:hypothetical protein